ncbi:MAG: helix-turn-helix transcriptional regulator [Bacteroidales bacterium]|nr:helix-turn-helix transcriptional regulator [Bacteroidales bacterium]MBR1769689.1 helix-turn-helix transcriptional regulator [Bacteroidales bacterium]
MDIKKAINLIKFKENCKQKDIAKALKVSENYLSDVVSGRSELTESFISKLELTFPYISVENTEIDNSATIEKDTDFNRLLSMYEEMQKKFFEQSDQIIKTNERLLNMLEDKGKRVAFSEQIEQSVLR